MVSKGLLLFGLIIWFIAIIGIYFGIKNAPMDDDEGKSLKKD